MAASRMTPKKTSTKESDELSGAVMNSLTAHIAVLDGEGHIVAVNDAWSRFAAANGGVAARTGVGTNYLQVCGAGGNGDVGEIVEGIRAVIYPSTTSARARS